MLGANRIVILDDHFNPMWEQQAVGRAYRIGQHNKVYVYRLAAHGTFEQAVQNQGIFKERLATRVVDRKNPIRRATAMGAHEYLFEPKPVKYEDLRPYYGYDCKDKLLEQLLFAHSWKIASVTPTETFFDEDGIELTEKEENEARKMFTDEQARLVAEEKVQAQEKKRLKAVQAATR